MDDQTLPPDFQGRFASVAQKYAPYVTPPKQIGQADPEEADNPLWQHSDRMQWDKDRFYVPDGKGNLQTYAGAYAGDKGSRRLVKEKAEEYAKTLRDQLPELGDERIDTLKGGFQDQAYAATRAWRLHHLTATNPAVSRPDLGFPTAKRVMGSYIGGLLSPATAITPSPRAGREKAFANDEATEDQYAGKAQEIADDIRRGEDGPGIRFVEGLAAALPRAAYTYLGMKALGGLSPLPAGAGTAAQVAHGAATGGAYGLLTHGSTLAKAIDERESGTSPGMAAYQHLVRGVVGNAAFGAAMPLMGSSGALASSLKMGGISLAGGELESLLGARPGGVIKSLASGDAEKIKESFKDIGQDFATQAVVGAFLHGLSTTEPGPYQNIDPRMEAHKARVESRITRAINAARQAQTQVLAAQGTPPPGTTEPGAQTHPEAASAGYVPPEDTGGQKRPMTFQEMQEWRRRGGGPVPPGARIEQPVSPEQAKAALQGAIAQPPAEQPLEQEVIHHPAFGPQAGYEPESAQPPLRDRLDTATKEVQDAQQNLDLANRRFGQGLFSKTQVNAAKKRFKEALGNVSDLRDQWMASTAKEEVPESPSPLERPMEPLEPGTPAWEARKADLQARQAQRQAGLSQEPAEPATDTPAKPEEMFDALAHVWKLRGFTDKEIDRFTERGRNILDEGGEEQFNQWTATQLERNHQVLESWLANPRQAPKSQETQDAISRLDAAAKRGGIDPASVRRGVEQRLQAAHADGQADAAAARPAPEPNGPGQGPAPPAGGTETSGGADQGANAVRGAAGGNELEKARAMGGMGAMEAQGLGMTEPPGLAERFKNWAKSLVTRDEGTIAKGVVRERLAEKAAKHEAAADTLWKARLYFAKNIEAQPETNRIAHFLRIMDAMESGNYEKLTDVEKDFADTVRKMIDQRSDQLEERGILQPHIENYIGHYWKDRANPNATPEELAARINARSPLAGPEGFKKRRWWETYRAGLESGLEPVSWNPADLVMRNLDEMDKSIFGHDVVADIDNRGMLKFTKNSDRPPPGWKTIDDKAMKVFIRKDKLLAQTGSYYMPEPVADVLTRYATPSQLAGSKAFQAFRGLGNMLNQMQLGLSAFHAGFVALEAQSSAASLAVQAFSRGEIGTFLKQLPGALIPGVAPVTSVLKGLALRRAVLDPTASTPEGREVADWLMKAGGRIKMDSHYGGDAYERFRLAWAHVMGGEKGSMPSAAWNALRMLPELTSKPIMEQLVPLTKLGVFSDLARFEMGKLGNNPDVAAVHQALGRAWDSVENRLGQMTYDNLFWNRTFKDLAMAVVRSVGWNTGTWRELGGGLKDIPSSLAGFAKGQGISSRLGYLIAMPFVAGMYGAAYHYLANGKGPDELKDYFFPKTGGTRKDGSADRVALPSYMRDVASLFNRSDEGELRVAQNAWGMAKHKLNPALSTIAEMLDNEDFYGTAIRDFRDPMWKQRFDTAWHGAKSVVPFGIRGFARQQEEGRPLGQSALSFGGITPASALVTRDWEQQRERETKKGSFQLTPLEKRRRAGFR